MISVSEKDYEKDKKRVTIIVSDDTKYRWQEYADSNKIEFSTISKLIRKAVNFYIDYNSQMVTVKNISQFSRDLKVPLTVIKGYTHLMIENYTDKLETDILFKIKGPA